MTWSIVQSMAEQREGEQGVAEWINLESLASASLSCIVALLL